MRGIRFVSDGLLSGYGEAGRGYLRTLRRAGISVTWTPMLPGDAWGLYLAPAASARVGDAELDELCNRPIAYDRVVVHLPPAYFERWRREEPEVPILGIAAWEADRLPSAWPAAIRNVDRIAVPSRWNREVFLRSGVDRPVHVVPHALPDVEPPSAGSKQPGAPFVFYTIGPWTERKAIFKTLEAYWRAFTRDDPVRLVIRTTWTDQRRARYGRRWQWIGRWCESVLVPIARLRRRFPSPAPIRLRFRALSAARLRALHRDGDCYVTLSRGEGWGLACYEAAAAGKAVVATAFGGHLDFLPAELADLVRARLVEVSPVGVREREFFGPGQRWADADVDHAAECLRRVFENPGEARRRGRELARHVRETFTAERVVERLLAAIEGDA